MSRLKHDYEAIPKKEDPFCLTIRSILFHTVTENVTKWMSENQNHNHKHSGAVNYFCLRKVIKKYGEKREDGTSQITLQHTATKCNTLHRSATDCNRIQHIVDIVL